MKNDELFIEGDKLPKPLPEKEINRLINEINLGNQEAKDILVRHNIKLVLYEVTGRFSAVDYDQKDLVSVGNIGLLKAIDSFDLSKKIKFNTYAIRCIDNEILLFLRKIKKEQSIESLNKTMYKNDEDNKLEYVDMIHDDSNFIDDYINKEIYKIIRQTVEALPFQEREAIMLYFGFYNGKKYKQKEIAEKLSTTQSSISKIIKKTLKELSIKLQNEGIIELRGKGKKIQKNNSNINQKVLKLY